MDKLLRALDGAMTLEALYQVRRREEPKLSRARYWRKYNPVAFCDRMGWL